MRHRKSFNHLSRKTAHRRAMLANMASSLIMHKRINTTTAKARALRVFVEPLITRSKEDTTHSRRIAFRELRDKNAVSELFREVAAKVGDRPGGYTRIIKLDSRLGDNADMCLIELVDFNENMLAEKAAAKPKSSRRRRGIKKKTEEDVAVGKETMVEDAVVEEGAGGDVEVVEDIADVDPDAGAVEVVGEVKEEEAKAEEPVEETKAEVTEAKAEEPKEEPKDETKEADEEEKKEE
ncbi:MAG: 50S ribosomal protein L17 [Bacteroidales bacterium]|nr:50S ribosomal protein L17 [Bacteroidales bacterium]